MSPTAFRADHDYDRDSASGSRYYRTGRVPGGAAGQKPQGAAGRVSR